MTKHIALFSLIALLALITGFLWPEQLLRPLFHYSGYYFVLIAFTLWGIRLAEVLGPNFFSHIKGHYAALLFAVILMGLIFHMSPPKFKILADETNLVGVSMAMHENKTVSLPIQGPAVEYEPFDYVQNVDPRPLLYPFVTSLFHSILGYSPYNGMAVNFFAGAGVLFLLYRLLAILFKKIYGYMGMIIMASCPLFIFWTTSSGFETLNLFFILFVFLVLYLFLINRDVKYAELLFFSLVLLAHCRYESVIFFAGLIFTAPYLLDRELIPKYQIAPYCVPLLLLPLAWQRQIDFVNEFVRNGAILEKSDQLFGLSNFMDNFSGNIFAMSGWSADYGFLPLVFPAAIVGGYLAGKKIFTEFGAITTQTRIFALYTMFSGGLLFILYTSFYWGDFTTDIDNRLALALLPFMVLPAVYCIYKLFDRRSQSMKLILMFLLLFQLFYYWPIGAQQNILQNNALSYMHQRVSHFLYSNYDTDHENLLLISDRPNLYVIHHIGSIGFNYAESQKNRLHFLNNTYYDHILAVQKCSPITGEVQEDNQLNEKFQLQKINRINISTQYYLKISTVKLTR